MTIYNWNQVEPEQMNPLISRKVIHGETVTVAQFRIQKGAVVPTHSHINEQISMIQDGALRFVIGTEEKVIRAGQAVHIPPNVPHSAEALEDCLALDVFSPVRDDWRRGEDAYLRKQPAKNALITGG